MSIENAFFMKYPDREGYQGKWSPSVLANYRWIFLNDYPC
jgi:hypothetical protein